MGIRRINFDLNPAVLKENKIRVETFIPVDCQAKHIRAVNSSGETECPVFDFSRVGDEKHFIPKLLEINRS
jgi:hypothetical protein